mmetsp:Transcript_60919/g.69673  ORF Transcript_60919/g.69673 Transcript_60919/m.69673 type:complete len:114 (-) Transcript_60919:360-701(-)
MENSEYNNYQSAGTRGKASKSKGRTSKNRRVDLLAKKDKLNSPQKSRHWDNTNPRAGTNQIEVTFTVSAMFPTMEHLIPLKQSSMNSPFVESKTTILVKGTELIKRKKKHKRR